MFNKGWYTAIISLNYQLNCDKYQQKVTLTGIKQKIIDFKEIIVFFANLAQRKHSFKYDIAASDVQIVVDALAGKKGFLVENIKPLTQIQVCYHLWGAVTVPKSSRMPCW